ARGIGRVVCGPLATREPPEQETVDRAEGEPPLPRRVAHTLDVIEQPGDLGGGKIRIEQEPGARRDRGLVSVSPKRGAGICGAAVRPDDGSMDRAPARALPIAGWLSRGW